jgi:5-methylthioadenosine/S-adenosylhomocysteine deaminase
MPPFDPGYGAEPFRSLVERAPGPEVYPPGDFRVEWGPIFHRGRLDGSARVLVLGQDPAAQETVVRRILVGAAGHRVQGFLAKCGIDRSYVMVNTFLYSVYGQWSGNRHRDDPAIAAYRHAWLDALTAGGRIEAVVAFGALADHAWQTWKQTPTGAAFGATQVHVTHPTHPESASGGSRTKHRELVAEMLAQWNTALPTLRAAIRHPDAERPLVPYGDAFTEADLAEIPSDDLPAGIPDWMRGVESWAERSGADSASKRRTVVMTIPSSVAVGAVQGVAADVAAPRDAMPRDAVPNGMAPTTPNVLADGVVVRPSLAAPRYALVGRIVTMDDVASVIPRGVVYVDGAHVAAVRHHGEDAPDGFADAPVVDTRGTIYPGLIELHNHLPYGVLPLWRVDRRYTNRDQWRGTANYRKLVIAPLGVLGASRSLSAAVARYTECKCLAGGVTTSQGVALAKQAGMQRFYHGVVRNAEWGGDASLPNASTHIADVAAADAPAFLSALGHHHCVLLHLSEGVDDKSRRHFLDLQIADDEWAIARTLAGIHAVALQPGDFKTLAQGGGAMIWSPFSNYLLYGATADVRAARTNRVRMGLGSDWSFTGSKNLMGELKVARLVSEEMGHVFEDRDLVAMATRDAAEILGWDSALGSIEAGKFADLVVLRGTHADPYAQLIEALETDVQLVVIGGIARYGTASKMERLTANDLEPVTVGGTERRLNLLDAASDEVVDGLTLADAATQIGDALADLPARAQRLRRLGREAATAPGWRLALDELAEPDGADSTVLDPAVPLGERLPLRRALAVVHADAAVDPTVLDPLTVADDPHFLDTIDQEPNLPAFLKTGLRQMYA